MLARSSRDRGGVKGQIFKAVEKLACIKADRGSGEEGSEKLPGEKGKLIMSGSGANGRKWNPEHELGAWAEEEKEPLLPCNTREGNQFAGLGTASCGEFHSYGFYFGFLKQEVKSESKEHLKESHQGRDKSGSTGRQSGK